MFDNAVFNPGIDFWRADRCKECGILLPDKKHLGRRATQCEDCRREKQETFLRSREENKGNL